MDWVKKIDQLLVELDKRPQFRFQPLSLQPVEKVLSKSLGTDVHLELSPKGWKKKEECQVSDAFLFSIFSSTLNASLFFTAEKKNMKLILEDPILSVTNSEMIQEITEGYLHYLLLESVAELQKQQGLSAISLQVKKENSFNWSEESFFYFELLFKVATSTAICKIYIPPSFRNAFEKRFSQLPARPFSDEMKESIFLDLSLEVGSSLVKQKELKKLEKGDFLLLDRCLYDPEAKKGSFLLVLEDNALFRGKITKEGCKLAEIPIYQEVKKMDENHKDEDAFFEEESLFDENEKLEESSFLPEETKEEMVEKEPRKAAAVQPSLNLDNLELHIKVEFCRIQMTAKALSELSIGNLLPLDVSIDSGVDLVINGKRFAKGELLRMGDHLGVRILEFTGQ